MESDNCLHKSQNNNLFMTIYVDDVLIIGSEIVQIKNI